MGINGVYLADTQYQGEIKDILPQNASVFAKELILIAICWYNRKIRETGVNTGYGIDRMQKQYYGGNTQKHEAWCAIFPYFIVDEASKLLGVKNNFPSYKEVWANAYRTYVLGVGRYGQSTNAIAGTVFYRKSKIQGASGHMGIVIAVNENTRKFYTIEGNIKLSDGKEGIGAWEYDFEELSKYQFKFLRTDLVRVPQSEPLDYEDCKYRDLWQQTGGKVIAKGNDNTGGGTGGDTGGNTGGGGSYETGGAVKKSFGNNSGYSNDWYEKRKQQERKIIRKDCVTTLLPNKEHTQHYSNLFTRKEVSADIFEANSSFSGKPNNIRNGSSLWYNQSHLDPKTATGFGIFTDKVGNTYYLINERMQNGVQFLQSEMLKALNPYIVRLDRGSNFETTAHNAYVGKMGLANDRPEIDIDRRLTTIFKQLPDEEDKRILSRINIQSGQGYYLFSFRDLMEIVEKRNIEIGSPIVFTFRAEQKAQTDLISSITMLLDVASGLVPMIPNFDKIVGENGIKIVSNFIKSSQQLLIDSAHGGGLSFSNSTKMIASLGQLAELISPATVKGVKVWAKGIEHDVGEWLKEAKVSLGQLYIYQDIKLAAQKLGTTVEWLKGLYEDYAEDVNGYINIINNYQGEELLGKKNILENAKNILMQNKIVNELRAGYLQSFISTKTGLDQIPLLRDFFVAGGADTVLPSLPGIDKFVTNIIQNTNINSKLSNDQRNMLISATLGYLPMKDAFQDIVLDSLKARAEEFAKAKIPFLFPSSISPEYIECFHYEIEHSVTKHIIGCRTGEHWDKGLRKCIPDTTGRGFTPNTGTVPNITPDTGTVPNITPKPYVVPNREVVPYITPKPYVVPRPEVLPKCIVIQNGKYYFRYITKRNSGINNLPPIKQGNIKLPANTKVIDNFNPATMGKNLNALQKISATPNNISLMPVQSGKPTNPFDVGAMSNPHLGDDGNLIPAMYVADKKQWYAQLNNKWVAVNSDCTLDVPTTTPKPFTTIPRPFTTVPKPEPEPEPFVVPKPFITPPPPEPYSPPPPEPETEKRYDKNGNCLNCPKMIQENKKIIYEYPKCNEHCCDDREEFY